jgi:hypothetical protein
MLDLLFVYFADAVGIVGVILTLAAYYLLNVGKLSSDNINYLMLNLLGSCMLFFSLMFNWNLSSVLIEIAWILISLIGIYRYIKARQQSNLVKE